MIIFAVILICLVMFFVVTICLIQFVIHMLNHVLLRLVVAVLLQMFIVVAHIADIQCIIVIKYFQEEPESKTFGFFIMIIFSLLLLWP